MIMGAIMIVAIVCFFFIVIPPEPEQELGQLKENEIGMMEEIKETVRLMVSKRMMYLNMQLAWEGVTIAYYNGMLIPIMVMELHNHTDLDENHKT
jgi:hypothetical protein